MGPYFIPLVKVMGCAPEVTIWDISVDFRLVVIGMDFVTIISIWIGVVRWLFVVRGLSVLVHLVAIKLLVVVICCELGS